MRRFGVVVVVLALLLGACGRGPTESSGTSQTPTSTSAQSPSGTPRPESAGRVAFIPGFVDDVAEGDRRDVWLYDLNSGSRRKVADDGRETDNDDPRFRFKEVLTYVTRSGDGPSVVFALDLISGERRELFRSESIVSMDWSRDGSSAAWLAGTRLSIRRAADGQTKDIALPPYPTDYGRGGGPEDEQLVAWSPDGEMILIIDTARCCYGEREETVFIVRRDGELIASKRGTFARWSNDGNLVYFRDFGDASDKRLQVLDVATGNVKRLPVETAFRLAPSPDGRFLAYDDDGDTPRIHVYDLQTGTRRMLGSGLAPLWLSGTTLAATRTRPCRSPDECVDVRWHGLGGSVVYSTEGDPPREIEIGTTHRARAR